MGFIRSKINRWRFSGKEIQTLGGIGLVDFGARLYDDYSVRWKTQDALSEKAFLYTPYAICNNNTINNTDFNGKETRVVQEEDGTYRVIGGILNQDRNIYVYSQDENGDYTINQGTIGITSSTTSFYNADANEGKGAWAIGSVINPSTQSGDAFLSSIFGNTPPMVDDYMPNAGENGKYDFKVTDGTGKPIPGIDPYRGMPIGNTRDGQIIFSSARDIGNIAAGYVAGANGMSWRASRIVFDLKQSFDDGHPSIESISTRNAEYYGWRIGSNFYNNSPAQKANNLFRSLWQWIVN